MSEFNGLRRARSWSSILLGFGISLGLCNGFLRGVGGDVDGEDVVDKPATTILHAVLRVALDPYTIFNETWFVTTGPVLRISVVLAKLSE